MQQTGCRACAINFYDTRIRQICRRRARRIPGEPPAKIWGKKVPVLCSWVQDCSILCLFLPFAPHTCCCTNRNRRPGGIVRAGVMWESSKTADSSADPRILTEFNTEFQSSNSSRSSSTCSVSAIIIPPLLIQILMKLYWTSKSHAVMQMEPVHLHVSETLYNNFCICR